MTEIHSINLPPPSAANAFRIGLKVNTVAWHYSQLLVPAFREKHLGEIVHGLTQIKFLCQERGAMPSEHEIELVIDELETWPNKYMDEQFFVEAVMDAQYEWGCSEKTHSDLLVLSERLAELIPPVELMIDQVIRNNLLGNCPESFRAYDFGKCLDAGRHSRRLPELIVRRPSESSSPTSHDSATDINLTDECPITDSEPSAGTPEAMSSLVGSRAICPRTRKSPTSGTARETRVIVPDNSEVIVAEPNEGEISPVDHWWFELRVLAKEVGVPIVYQEPDDASKRCDFVEKMKDETIAILEKARWRFVDGQFQYLDGPPFELPPRETRLLRELLKNDCPVTRERLMNVKSPSPRLIRAFNTGIHSLHSMLKQKLSEQLGNDMPTKIIVGSRRQSEMSYSLAKELRQMQKPA